jgi:hypothetical protein
MALGEGRLLYGVGVQDPRLLSLHIGELFVIQGLQQDQ